MITTFYAFVIMLAWGVEVDPVAAQLTRDLDCFSFACMCLRYGDDHTGDRLLSYLVHLKHSWWNQAGREREYLLEVEYTRWCRSCWEELGIAVYYTDDARTGRCEPGLRRQHLKESLERLRHHLGREAYAMGNMPEFPAGAWSFERWGK